MNIHTKTNLVFFTVLAATATLSARVIDVTSKSEFDRYIGGNMVVVEFSQTTCPPCKAIAPQYEKLSKQFADTPFLKLEIDNPTAPELMDLSDTYSVMSTPTILIFKDGTMQKRSDIDTLANDLNALLDTKTDTSDYAEGEQNDQKKSDEPGFFQNIINKIKGWFGWD